MRDSLLNVRSELPPMDVGDVKASGKLQGDDYGETGRDGSVHVCARACVRYHHLCTGRAGWPSRPLTTTGGPSSSPFTGAWNLTLCRQSSADAINIYVIKKMYLYIHIT